MQPPARAVLLLLLLACAASCASARGLRSYGCALHDKLREYARNSRFHEVPNDFHHGGETGRVFFQLNWEPSIRCIADKRVGVFGDGGKWICDPDCLLVARNCTVFSIGSNNQWDFENAMEPYGCRIHTFDHTVAAPATPAHVTFHPYGAAGQSAGPSLKSLPDMYALAGVTGRIDVLKIDCEGCEYAVFRDPATLAFIKRHVKQILVEIHFTTTAATEALAQALTDAGFRAFSKEPNIQYSDGSCIEYALLNIHAI